MIPKTLATTPTSHRDHHQWTPTRLRSKAAGETDEVKACGLLIRPDGYVAWAADTFDPDDKSLVARRTKAVVRRQASVALIPTVT
jgi:hypothetical protein